MKTNQEATYQPPQAYYWTGVFLVFCSAFCFALKGIFIKMAYQYGIDSISLLTLRMVFSAPIFASVAYRLSTKTNQVKVSQLQWRWVVALGVWGYYVSSYFNFLGFQYITAGLERVLLFTYPTFVLLINAVFRKKKITSTQAAALLLTYAGILLAFLQNTGVLQQKDLLLGAFWVILSGFTYAIYLVGSDGIISQIGPQKFTAYAMLAATVPTVLHCALANGLNIFHFVPQIYWIGITMAILVTALPTFMLAEGIKRLGSSNTSIINSIGPVFTIVLATSVLGETISGLQIVGTLLVLLGVFLIGWKGKK
ncbi:MAG: DMT family transporter [Runella slithyformis]|nr:MAG: DMT family transporter [Runella slithyformis]